MSNIFKVTDLVAKESLRSAHEKLAFIGTIDRQYDESFKMSGSGEITINDKKDEVEPVTTFEPVAASAALKAAACGCGEGDTMTKDERIKALLKKLKMKDDPALFAALTEDQLKAFEAANANKQQVHDMMATGCIGLTLRFVHPPDKAQIE